MVLSAITSNNDRASKFRPYVGQPRTMKDALDDRPAELDRNATRAIADLSRSARVSPIWFSGFLIFALAAIFLIPRFVPNAPSASDSYLFGYNNRAGIILLFIFAAVAAVWTGGLYRAVPADGEITHLPRRLLLIALAVTGFGCALMYWLAGQYNGFGESFYLIDRIWLLQSGRVPYRDFEFAYGPAQLYGPLFLHKVLHLDLAASYYLFWASSYLAGAYLLFKAVDLVEFRSKVKDWIFAVLFLGGLFAMVRMGTNYTFLRYALPVYLVVVFQRRLAKARMRSAAVTLAAGVAFTGVLLLTSPETAVAFTWASVGVCVLDRSLPFRFRCTLAAFLLFGDGLIFWAALKLHVLDAMLADGGGAISFPIVPGPTILVYFAAIFICACWFYRMLRDRSGDHATLGLLLLSMPMAAAALGRCDPSHVFWNGLSAFLAAMLYLSHNRRAWLSFAAAFLIGVVLLPNASEFYLFLPQLRSAYSLNKHPGVRPTEEQIAAFLSSSWRGDYIAPFGFRPDGFGTYHSPRIEYGRFEDLIDVSTPRSVEEKVAEMREQPGRALILPYHAEEYCHTKGGSESQYLSVLMLFPYVGKKVHPDFVREPICRYMADHYEISVQPSASTYWYGIWKPKE
jgi:hypothetical protein